MGGVTRSTSDTFEGKWGVRADQTQEMKGKEGSDNSEGQEAKSGLALSRRRLDTSGENPFFPDILLFLCTCQIFPLILVIISMHLFGCNKLLV